MTEQKHLPGSTADYLQKTEVSITPAEFQAAVKDAFNSIADFITTEPKEISEQFVQDAIAVKNKLEDLIAHWK